MMRNCANCIYHSNLPYITLDESGVCNLCRQIEMMKNKFNTGNDQGLRELEDKFSEIKRNGAGKKYDCIIGVSGGVDSSYLLYLAHIKNLRVLAVHYDNTWNSAIASQNIVSIVRELDIDLYTYVVDSEEASDIFYSFFKAGVPELEAATDLAFAYILRKVARKNNIRYILEGHSFEAEGITPLNNNYFDGRYIKNIHQKYGTVKLKSYPLMTFSKFLFSSIFYKVEIVRPLWHVRYSKKEAIRLLEEKFNWEYYGGHHLENYMSAFLHTIYLPTKFGLDFRLHTLSAQVRSGEIARIEAENLMKMPNKKIDDLILYLCNRLRISQDDYARIMNSEKRSWQEFKTYKNYFYHFRKIFLYLANRNRVPWSFYMKYCEKR